MIKIQWCLNPLSKWTATTTKTNNYEEKIGFKKIIVNFARNFMCSNLKDDCFSCNSIWHIALYSMCCELFMQCREERGRATQYSAEQLSFTQQNENKIKMVKRFFLDSPHPPKKSPARALKKCLQHIQLMLFSVSRPSVNESQCVLSGVYVVHQIE